MDLLSKLKQLPKDATIGFKWQDQNGNWFAESDGYTVADMLPIIEKAERWDRYVAEVNETLPDFNS